MSRSATVLPGSASACSFAAALPRATRTAVPGAIRIDVAAAAVVTGTARSVFGVAGGNAPRPTMNAPVDARRRAPQSGVKSEMPFVPGTLFRKFSARR